MAPAFILPPVLITPSLFLSSLSSGTKPLPPHVGHCFSSAVPLSMTPSPLQSGQVFLSASRSPPVPRRARFDGLDQAKPGLRQAQPIAFVILAGAVDGLAM